MIVDDEPYTVASLKAMLVKDKRVDVVGTHAHPQKAVEEIIVNPPDLIFLDIQMPGMNGFDLIRALHDAGVKPYVIFVTAYDHYAVEAIKYSVFDYLLKPVDSKKLRNSLERFLDLVEEHQQGPSYVQLLEAMNPDRKVRFNNATGFIVMPLHDILYVQADWNYAKIFRSQDDAEAVTMNLGAIEKLLPATQFIRINRSVMVNFKYLYRIKRADRQCILIKDGVEYTFNIPFARIKMLEKIL